MTSPQEFTALLQADSQSGFQHRVLSPVTKEKPPQAPVKSEQIPIHLHLPLTHMLPPISPNKSPLKQSEYFFSSTMTQSIHARSSSDFVLTSSQPDPSLPSAKQQGHHGLPPAHNATKARYKKPPPRTATALTPTSTKPSTRGHRRSKSDVPLAQDVHVSGRLISKSDLLKNFPDPRWGSPSKPITSHNLYKRRGSGSDSLLLDGTGRGALGNSLGYGSFSIHPLLENSATIGLELKANKPKHTRTSSDASLTSVTANITKSALFRDFTEQGAVRLQLPKDNFRILMDSSLEAGKVYKRQLLDNENEVFVEFHTVEDNPLTLLNDCACLCDCAHCNRCAEKQKALPPTLFVMAVDSTLYRRMLDEVIASKNTPCGLFFCGHHDDVEFPDIKIAVAIVFVVFVLMIVGAGMTGGN